MARPQKDGIEYFPMDVDFFDDEKIEAIAGEFGADGEVVVLRLLCAIYRNGYYIEATDILKMKIAKNAGVVPDMLDRIIERAVKWQIFDQKMYDEHRILTSRGVQRRYFEAVKRRRSKSVDFPYLLVNVDILQQKPPFNGVNVDNMSTKTQVNVDKNTTKESKVKKSKVNNTTPISPSGVVADVPPPPGMEKTPADGETPGCPEAPQADPYRRVLDEMFSESNAPHIEAFCLNESTSLGYHLDPGRMREVAELVVSEWHLAPPPTGTDLSRYLLNHVRKKLAVLRDARQPDNKTINPETDGLQAYLDRLNHELQRPAGAIPYP